MNKRYLWLIILLCGVALGGKGGCDKGGNQNSKPAVPATSPSASPVTQDDYFAKLGLGGNYGPHYNAFDSYLGYTNYSDAKNSVMQTSVPLDFQQMRDAGFQTVRAYGDTANVWVAMINEANLRHLNVVYTVALCGSNIDDSNPKHCCLKGLDCTGSHFYDLLDFAEIQLEQIIDLVGVHDFQQVVKLILVGNEALVANGSGHENTSDLINAIIAIKALLVRKGIALGDGFGNGMDVSTCTQIGQMTSASGHLLAQEFTPGAPVVENIYPFQFGDLPTDLSRLQQRVEALRAAYPANPVMIGETGWPTRGTFTTKDGTHTYTGNLADAQQYYRVLYPYLRSAQIPTLIFEVYDQPSKDTTNNTLGDSEQNYGVFRINNTMKDPAKTDMYPNSAYTHKPKYDTSLAAVFTFNGLEHRAPGNPNIITDFSPTAITINLTDPSGFNLNRTYKPFAMKTASGNQQMVWPSINLYPGSATAISFTSNVGQAIACTNKVVSVNTTPRPNPPGADFPAFSGGVWTYRQLTCTACPKVDWGDGTGITAQNIFLHPDW